MGFSNEQNNKTSENDSIVQGVDLSDTFSAKKQLDSLLSDSSESVNYVRQHSDSLVISGGLIGKDWKYRTLLKEKLARISENPGLFKQSLFRAISITVFFPLPLFAFLLYVTHLRKHPYYVDHLVYSVHFHTFIFVLFLFFLLASRFDFTGFWLMMPASFIYFLLSLRNAYSQSFGKAFLKSILIIPIYTALIGIALLFAVLAGAITA